MNMLITPVTLPIASYEYMGIVELPENDTLTWLDELEDEEDSTNTRQIHTC
jgi:hypothetical protein